MKQMLAGQECTNQLLVVIWGAVNHTATAQEQLVVTLEWQVEQQELTNEMLQELWILRHHPCPRGGAGHPPGHWRGCSHHRQ